MARKQGRQVITCIHESTCSVTDTCSIKYISVVVHADGTRWNTKLCRSSF